MQKLKSAIVRSRTQTLIVGDGEGTEEEKEGGRHPPLQLFNRGCAYVSETFPPSQCLGLVWKKKLNVTRQKHAFTNQKKCTATQNKRKKTKAGFSRLNDIRPANRASLFSEEKISKGGVSKEKVKKKGCGEACYINKQTI